LGRPKDDFYPTPTWVTEAFLDRVEFSKCVWEPACGDGAISKVLLERGHNVMSADLYDHGYGFSPLNFLEVNDVTPRDIITNPPYNIAKEFVDHALKVGGRKVAMLLRLSFLESKARKEWFKTTPLKTVYVMSKRVTMYPSGERTAGSGTMAMAWFLWDKEYDREPTLDWI
jgi:hypothetical protein